MPNALTKTAFDHFKQLGLLCDALELNPVEIIEFTKKQETLINQHINLNANKYNSYSSAQTFLNNKELIRQIIKEELNKY